jgi:hypothetical protein
LRHECLPCDTHGFLRFANSGRNILDAPGLPEVNLSVLQNIYFEGKGWLRFRGEVFNAMNCTNLTCRTSM